MRVLVGAIARYRARHGYAPSMRELMRATGLSSTSNVAYWLDACERAGLIVRAPRLARAVTLTAAGEAIAGPAAEEAAPPAAQGRAA